MGFLMGILCILCASCVILVLLLIEDGRGCLDALLLGGQVIIK